MVDAWKKIRKLANPVTVPTALVGVADAVIDAYRGTGRQSAPNAQVQAAMMQSPMYMIMNLPPEQQMPAFAALMAGGVITPEGKIEQPPLTYEGAMAKRFGSQIYTNNPTPTTPNAGTPTVTTTEPPRMPGQNNREFHIPTDREALGAGAGASNEPARSTAAQGGGSEVKQQDMSSRTLRNVTEKEYQYFRNEPEKAAELIANEHKVSPALRRKFVTEAVNAAKQWYMEQSANHGLKDVYAFYEFLEGYLDGMVEREKKLKGE